MRQEQTGKRDLTFSNWHRERLGDEATAIDVDLVGYCNGCTVPLYVIESTRVEHKSTVVLNEVSRRLGCDGFLVRYDVAADGTLADLRAHWSRVVDGHRRFVGHAEAFADLLDHLRLSHRCEDQR